jgi:hypothetical protein
MDLQDIRRNGVDRIDVVKYGGQVAGSCEQGKEPSASIKYRELLD